MIQIGLVQAEAGERIAENLHTLRRFVREAAASGCRLLCFPECFLTGYAPQKAQALAIPASAPLLEQVSREAVKHKMDILAGFMERDGDTFYITHGVFGRDGTQAFYRKTHLGKRERQFFSQGQELKVFSLEDGLRIGIQLCVEGHYPEITQTLALKGAQVIFLPHAVPQIAGDRQRLWSKYIPARSYDNRVYMACCNLWEPPRFGGGCLVTDPQGEVVEACFAQEPALLCCRLDPEWAAAFRAPEDSAARRFYPALRRKELYE